MPIFGLLNKGVPLCHNMLKQFMFRPEVWIDRLIGTEVELMRAAIDSIEKHNASLYAKLNMTDPNPPLTLEDLTKQAADIQSKIDKFKDK